MMAKTPELITVLDYRAFFYPLPNVIERQLFSDAGDRFAPDFEVAYCHHLWNGGTGEFLEKIDEAWIRSSTSIYASIAREVEGIAGERAREPVLSIAIPPTNLVDPARDRDARAR